MAVPTLVEFGGAVMSGGCSAAVRSAAPAAGWVAGGLSSLLEVAGLEVVELGLEESGFAAIGAVMLGLTELVVAGVAGFEGAGFGAAEFGVSRLAMSAGLLAGTAIAIPFGWRMRTTFSDFGSDLGRLATACAGVARS